MVSIVLDKNIPITKIEGSELEVLSPYATKFKDIIERYRHKVITDIDTCAMEDRMYKILEMEYEAGNLPYDIYPDVVLDKMNNKLSVDFYRRTQYSVSSLSPLALFELNSTLGEVNDIDDMASGIHEFCKRNKVPLNDLINKLERLTYEDRLTDKAIRLSINVLNVFKDGEK